MKDILLAGVAVVGVVVAAAAVWLSIDGEQELSRVVTSFEECAAAGNPVMESYPRQCAADGQTFVEELDTAELQEVTLTGRETCLPHRNTDGPQTLECMLGFEATAGTYYGLDIASSLRVEEVMGGQTFTATGVIVPLMVLSSDVYQRYGIEGVFRITSIQATDSKKVTDGTEPAPAEPPSSQGACYVGGCSGQLCSDQPDMMSTCEWREAYACYQDAACERQADGQCGWTESAELQACLAEAA